MLPDENGKETIINHDTVVCTPCDKEEGGWRHSEWLEKLGGFQRKEGER